MSTSTAEVVCAAQTGDVLGEVPIWCPRERALYWIDAFRPAIRRLVPVTGEVTSWTPPQKLGSFALRETGGFLLATRIGIATFDPASGAFELVANPEADRPGNLLNDGRCDRQGRFWVGSMDKMLQKLAGRLYRIDADHSAHVMDDDIFLFNGICFSPDGRVVYYADSHHKRIYARDLDAASGAVGPRKLFAATEGRPGVPDGATVDAEGFLWSAQFDSGTVVRYAPDGRVDRVVTLPVSRPTACTFGGDDLRTLYVTTATFRLPEEKRAREPHAGGVLAVDVGVGGVPEVRFAG
jgi:L-arabinonolactonase